MEVLRDETSGKDLEEDIRRSATEGSRAPWRRINHLSLLAWECSSRQNYEKNEEGENEKTIIPP
jgi:hypothetical protein